MKTLIDTLEKFAAFNTKSKEMKLREYSHRVHVQNGYKFATNGYYIFAEKSNEPESNESPDPNIVLSARKCVAAKVTVDVNELEQALKNADVFAREGCDMVQLCVTAGLVTVHAHDEEFGKMSRSLTSAVVMDGGAGMIVAFNTSYLRDCARFVAGKGETVTIELTRTKSPAFLSGNNPDKVAGIMPMITDSYDDVEAGILDLYCPAKPGEKSATSPADPFAWNEWENSQPNQGMTIPATHAKENAVECDAITCWNSSDEHGKCTQYPALIALAFHPVERGPEPEPEPVAEVVPAPVDEKPTKSALMTALNKERARIRKAFKNMPSRMQIELSRLYRAFGNLQRKNWKETTEKAPRNADNSLDWVTFTTTKKLYSLVTGAADRPIDVTNEFKSLKESAHVNA